MSTEMKVSDFSDIKPTLPVLGIGLGLRRELTSLTFDSVDRIDWLEIVPENYMDIGGAAKERLDEALSLFPIVTHGVNLSLGSADELNRDYLSSIKRLLDYIDAPWWSDHLCFTSVQGRYMHDLLPLPLNSETVDHVADKIKEAQEFVGRPLIVENISYYMHMPGSQMSDAEFLSAVLEKADCGLLLDVNNVYVNSINLNFDPYKYLDSIPLERTVQMHVAGHSHADDMIIDTHGAAVIEPVFELTDYVLHKAGVKAVMLERDQNYPDFAEILAEVDQIRNIARQSQPGLGDPPARADYHEKKVETIDRGAFKGKSIRPGKKELNSAAAWSA